MFPRTDITSTERYTQGVLRHLALAVVYASCLLAQSPPTKQGGVCFRVDDNQDLAKVLEYTSLFNKYGLRYSIALNLGAPPDAEYLYGISTIQSMGHEIMDHTPNHATHYFTVHDTAGYTGRSGIDRIVRNKIYLKYELTDSVRIQTSEGRMVLEGNRAISKEPGAFTSFLSGSVFGLYLPSLGMLTHVSSVAAAEPADVDTAYLQSYWFEPVDFARQTELPFHTIGRNDIRLPDEAFALLAERSQILAKTYSLAPPRTWIQPGGHFPQLTRAQVKEVLNKRFGYVAAAVYPNSSLQVYREYDPNQDAQYGMMWGDFLEDVRPLSQVKGVIADRVAKHYMVIGHSHFTGLLGGWDGYMSRMDSLLAWLRDHKDKISLGTYTDWAERLYGNMINPYENIFPPLNVDLDENHYPDGFYDSVGWTDGTLDSTDGSPDSTAFSYVIRRLGSICYVSELAGLEKGENEFTIWTKGSPRSVIDVSFRFDQGEPVIFQFPADSKDWTSYALTQSLNGVTRLVVPDSASVVSIRIMCSSYGGGTIKVSGMSLRKKCEYPLEIISAPPLRVVSGGQYLYQIETRSAVPDVHLRFELTTAPAWLVLDQGGMLAGDAPEGSMRIPVAITVRNDRGDSAVQRFDLNVVLEGSVNPVRFLSVPETLVTPRHLYEYRLAGTSEHYLDRLTYKLVVGPKWLTVSNNECVTGVAPSDNMVTPVVVKIQDQHGNIAFQTYQLHVSPMVVDNFEGVQLPTDRMWYVSSGSGTISTLYDSVVSSTVLRTVPHSSDGFRVDRYGMWNASTFVVKANPSANFTFYVWVIDTTGKSFFVQYITGNGTPSRSTGSVIIPIGTQYRSGWHEIARDLNEDLRSAGWVTPISKISMFSIRGAVLLDDLIVGENILPRTITAVLDLPGVPTEYSISNAFPNPFNATSSIVISLKEREQVSIRIFDITGQLVTTLLDDSMPSGRFLVSWNADEFASGSYYMRVHAGTLSAVRKLVLLK